MSSKRLYGFCVLFSLFVGVSFAVTKQFSRKNCHKPLPGVGLVHGGSIFARGKYPFLAALFKNKIFFCGGSLVSDRFVLTAAHCLQYKGPNPVTPTDEVKVHLGKWNLTDESETGVIVAHSEDFFIHPDWNVTETRFDADIALIRLASVVSFSENIFPICMWQESFKPPKVDGGTTIGWGGTEKHKISQTSDVPHEAKLKIHSINVCWRNEDVRDIISENGLCVGGDGIGPCSGDSGSGLLTVQGGENFLRGIVSASTTTYYGSCDVNTPAVYMNVASFTVWIEKILDATDELQCDFAEDYNGYACFAENLEILSENVKFTKISGQHEDGRGINSVTRLRFLSQKTPYLPVQLSNVLPNLGWYFVEDSGVVEISRKNFADLSKLTKLFVYQCPLQKVHFDAFYDLVALTHLYLDQNKIETIHRDTFIANRNLLKLDISENSIRHLDGALFRNNPNLKDLRATDNQLTSIGPDLLTFLPALNVFNFNSNPCTAKLSESPSKDDLRKIFLSDCQV